MSYSLTVRTHDGQTTVSTSGDVPEGEHQVSGHEDAAQVSLAVTRSGPDGRFVASASHSHSKE